MDLLLQKKKRRRGSGNKVFDKNMKSSWVKTELIVYHIFTLKLSYSGNLLYFYQLVRQMNVSRITIKIFTLDTFFFSIDII